MKRNAKKIILWVLTGFMFLSAFVFFPSAASILMFVFCVFSIPIEKIQEFWRGKGLNKILKTTLLCVLFVVSMLSAPTDRSTDQSNSNDAPSNVQSNHSSEIDSTEQPEAPAEIETDTEQIDQNPEEQPVPENSAANEKPIQSEAEPEENHSQEPAAVTTIHGQPSDTIVYVSRSNKIHSVPDCSGMKKYTELTLGEADSHGYKYCDNCW